MARADALARIAKAQTSAPNAAVALRAAGLRSAQQLYELALTIDHVEKQHDLLCAVVAARAMAGDLAGALQAARLLKRPYYVGEATRTIATEMTKRGDTARAVALLRANATTKDSVYDIRRFAWDVRAVVVERGDEAPVIALLQHAQALDDAKEEEFLFFTGVHHSSEFVPPLMIIAAALTHANKTAAALKVGRQIKKDASRTTVLGGVARILANGGRIIDALHIARDDRDHAAILRRAVTAYGPFEGNELLGTPPWVDDKGMARTFDAAMQTASAFATQAERDDAYGLIAATALAPKTDDVVWAIRATAPIQGAIVRFPLLLAIGEAQAEIGTRDASIATFKQAQALALQDEYPAYQLRLLAESHASAGQIEEALAVVEMMRGKKSASYTEVNGKPVDHDRAFALYAIAKAMAKAGRVPEALALARQTETDGERIMNGIGVVAEGLAEAGKIDEALEAAKAQTNIYWRDSLLLQLVKERVRAGRFDHAKRLQRGIARDYESAQALLAIANGIFIKAGLYGEEPENPGVRTADGWAAMSEALRLTTVMKPPNLALDILAEAGHVLWN
jgi:hypothetical protein